MEGNMKAVISVLMLLCFNNYVHSFYLTLKELQQYADERNSEGDICRLKPKAGPCRASIQAYYYDSISEQCQEFMYGGCGGNANNFETIDLCREHCVVKKQYIKEMKQPLICFLEFEYGRCYGDLERYYYDSTDRICKKNIYSGCRGNANNFKDIYKCRETCETT